MVVLAFVAVSVAVMAWICALGSVRVNGPPAPGQYIGDDAVTQRIHKL